MAPPGVSWLKTSRYRVALVALGLVLALDVGRSIFARLGYAHPTSIWQPDPAVYADLAWPPGSDLGAGAQAYRGAAPYPPDWSEPGPGPDPVHQQGLRHLPRQRRPGADGAERRERVPRRVARSHGPVDVPGRQ